MYYIFLTCIFVIQKLFVLTILAKQSLFAQINF